MLLIIVYIDDESFSILYAEKSCFSL